MGEDGRLMKRRRGKGGWGVIWEDIGNWRNLGWRGRRWVKMGEDRYEMGRRRITDTSQASQ